MNTKLTTILLILTSLLGTPKAMAQAALEELNASDVPQQEQPEPRSAHYPQTEIISAPTAAVSEPLVTPPAQPITYVSTTEADPKQEAAFEAAMGQEEYKQFSGAKLYADQFSTYTMGADDVVLITVMRHPEVSGEYIINKEGKIQYEFVGDLVIAGLTKEQAIKALFNKLSQYIINPEINIKIIQYNSKIVYVVGEVGNPGKIPMKGDTITVREALLDAGLPLLSGQTEKAALFTPSNNGRIHKRRVNVQALLYRGDLRQNLVMKPGDTLYIPPTFWAKALRAISPVTTPIGQVSGSAGASKAVAL